MKKEAIIKSSDLEVIRTEFNQKTNQHIHTVYVSAHLHKYMYQHTYTVYYTEGKIFSQ